MTKLHDLTVPTRYRYPWKLRGSLQNVSFFVIYMSSDGTSTGTLTYLLCERIQNGITIHKYGLIFSRLKHRGENPFGEDYGGGGGEGVTFLKYMNTSTQHSPYAHHLSIRSHLNSSFFCNSRIKYRYGPAQ